MDETGVYYTERSKSERKTPIQYTNTYIWNLETSLVAQMVKRLPTMWETWVRSLGREDPNNNPVCETAKETQMYRTVFWILWERVTVG